MEVLPLPGPDHQGYLLATGRRAVAIDPPLDVDAAAEFIPGWLRLAAVIETGIPSTRIAGGRLLAEAMDVPLAGPGPSIKGALQLRDGTRVHQFPELRVLNAPGFGEHDIAIAVEGMVFIGDLDRSGWVVDDLAADRVTSTRRGLAAQFPDGTAHGSKGTAKVADLPGLPAPTSGRPPLNFEAVNLTNRGQADMFWADPRYGADARSYEAGYVKGRSASPWAPIILDLRADGVEIEGARRVAPARFASEMVGLAAGRELVVVADDDDVAEQAARFLARLGMNAAFVSGTWVD